MMTFSAPILRQQPTFSVALSSLSRIDNLEDYLRCIDNSLQNLNLKINRTHTTAIAQLKETLTRLEVAQIRTTAIERQIRDFFPTHELVIEKMLSIAEISRYHRVLEPSAGSGDLACAIAQLGVSKIDCVELHPLLQKALKLQGFNLLGADFLATQPEAIYDRILANPPFSNNGVARHTQHAFKFLKPGGKLISLAHHYQLKPSQTDKAFFAWLLENNARFLNCGRAFANSDRSSNVLLQIIVIDKL